VKRATKAPATASSPATDTPDTLDTAPTPDPVSTASTANTAFPIVGIGASAGGLAALEQFLRHVPAASGLAFVFVVVQHLDPNHKGIMVELLQRATLMPVAQITDRMQVEPDHVYVIPPNRDLSILHGVLHLLEPAAPRGKRLPIDFFFRALADDRQDKSVGVILSGMGSDGTPGLRAIKEKAGAVFVQDPASAKFEAMPKSAIDAGLADVVAPAEELAGRIVACLKHIPLLFARPALEQIKPAVHHSLQIFATDLDKDAIDQARTGAYPANITADVPEERLRRFFVQEKRVQRDYRVAKEIRDMVIFAPQNGRFQSMA